MADLPCFAQSVQYNVSIVSIIMSRHLLSH